MRVLGIDYGDAGVGIAITDPLGYTAQGITTIRRKTKKEDIEELKKICAEYDVEKIVIGLPKNMNNTIGFAGEKILEFSSIYEDYLRKGTDNSFWLVNTNKVVYKNCYSRKLL